jgi:hypothetical protein
VEKLLHVHGARRAQLGLLLVLVLQQIADVVQHLLVGLNRVLKDAVGQKEKYMEMFKVSSLVFEG